MPGFYPDGHKLGATYAEQWDAVVQKRLSVAGKRLGDLLNESMDGRH